MVLSKARAAAVVEEETRVRDGACEHASGDVTIADVLYHTHS